MNSSLYETLSAANIAYDRIDHPAVYTCEEAQRLVPTLPGAKTKNLFLRNGKGNRHYLVAVPPGKSVDMRALGTLLNESGLGLASPERLQQHLAIAPGAVSLLAVVNDAAAAVGVVIDEDLWCADAFLCHPLVNTSTLVLSKAALEQFLHLTRHPPRILKVPSKS